MAIEVDFSAFNQLAVDIKSVPPGSEKTLKQAVEVNARRVKDAWNGKLYREGHAKRTGRSITYDVGVGHQFGLFALSSEAVHDVSFEAEIGAPTGAGRQAGVVRLLENGSINNGAYGYGAAALHENEADLQAGVEKALDDAFKDAGL